MVRIRLLVAVALTEYTRSFSPRRPRMHVAPVAWPLALIRTAGDTCEPMVPQGNAFFGRKDVPYLFPIFRRRLCTGSWKTGKERSGSVPQTKACTFGPASHHHVSASKWPAMEHRATRVAESNELRQGTYGEHWLAYQVASSTSS